MKSRRNLDILGSIISGALLVNTGEYWRITGSATTPAVQELELLAALAGATLKRVINNSMPSAEFVFSEADDKTRWYRALRAWSGGFEVAHHAYQTNENGEFAGNISLTHCMILHSYLQISALGYVPTTLFQKNPSGVKLGMTIGQRLSRLSLAHLLRPLWDCYSVSCLASWHHLSARRMS